MLLVVVVVGLCKQLSCCPPSVVLFGMGLAFVNGADV